MPRQEEEPRGRKKVTMKDMQAFAKKYKSEHCPPISKMKKAELSAFVNSKGFMRERHGLRPRQGDAKTSTTSILTAFPARTTTARTPETVDSLKAQYKKLKEERERLTKVDGADVSQASATATLQKVRDLNKKMLEIMRKVKAIKAQQKKK